MNSSSSQVSVCLLVVACVELDVLDEGDVEIPLLDSQDDSELLEKRRFPRLSRRSRRILSFTIAVFAVSMTLLSISLAGRKRHKKDYELYSYANDNGKNEGFGFLNNILNPEKTEKLFL